MKHCKKHDRYYFEFHSCNDCFDANRVWNRMMSNGYASSIMTGSGSITITQEDVERWSKALELRSIKDNQYKDILNGKFPN